MPETNNQNPHLAEQLVKGEIPVPNLINGLTFAAFPLLVFFAYRASEQADLLGVAVLIAAAVLLMINALAYFLLRHDTLQRRTFICVITALFIYLATGTVERGAAILWLFAYPPVVFYISTMTVGIITCLMGFAGIALVFSPLGQQWFDASYGSYFAITMVTAFGFEIVCCFVLDLSRRRSKASLLALAQDYEYAAKHDAMTDLANRRQGLDALEHEYERFQRKSRHFSVVLLDIDHFKGVNDTYGHQVGDLMIVMVAEQLKRVCRRMDTVSRWGGEEFLVILPETGAEAAKKIAERIRQTIAEQSVFSEEHGEISATVSAGVASMRNAASIDRVLQEADDALYQSKTGGRNRVSVHRDALETPASA